ncbi:16S rRNA (cytidine1402-2'-O)-methyltransferase [Methylorubrum extorquens]|uniref:16S rRNA (cytidine(1402)-2'-O)-methyltransferase n=1 Tax=Methylorubrum extorquens TaxID=408 RepID=UPI00209F6FF7|nr:16S rRNA (cytidine(1402)-2'-O)-methyltransferase [Methylorubrum extorquens]MCP1556905.1 16S rRNA (cytidine1402-2'-O)-methyltransferase [Methylorubrum extorquens]MDF9790481.1 16S rRNA (cytidine1402-2'-O)-methyltransferase [Methylorubrum extorquens]MDF9862184.1 16S rRNA (cytidine1402-2'-O)-methyltransferase [Methylorubrum pseudosasae]MDH6664977.1 16S rRNA (cytidine1402-2'-O)-methyltransferase [Methylorubrum zatmanii]
MTQRLDKRPEGAPRSPATFTAFGLAAEAESLAPGLYVVATPIGNLRDVSFRALATLAAADAVLAEDTRVTRTLLMHYGITTPLLSYHEHSNEAVRERMVMRLKAGETLALVSDAGTPLVSDPGFKLVQAAIAAGIPVTPIPGPSAVMTAIVAAGLPTDRFFFEGFLPQKSGARRNRLEALATIPGTLVVFESPHRLPEMLADAAATLGPERPAAVARELTKLFETIRRDSLGALAEAFAQEGPPKGEVVVVIGTAPEDAAPREADTGLDARIEAALARHSIKDAAALVADETGQPKRVVYARALVLARRADDENSG